MEHTKKISLQPHLEADADKVRKHLSLTVIQVSFFLWNTSLISFLPSADFYIFRLNKRNNRIKTSSHFLGCICLATFALVANVGMSISLFICLSIYVCVYTCITVLYIFVHSFLHFLVTCYNLFFSSLSTCTFCLSISLFPLTLVSQELYLRILVHLFSYSTIFFLETLYKCDNCHQLTSTEPVGPGGLSSTEVCSV